MEFYEIGDPSHTTIATLDAAEVFVVAGDGPIPVPPSAEAALVPVRFTPNPATTGGVFSYMVRDTPVNIAIPAVDDANASWAGARPLRRVQRYERPTLALLGLRSEQSRRRSAAPARRVAAVPSGKGVESMNTFASMAAIAAITLAIGVVPSESVVSASSVEGFPMRR